MENTKNGFGKDFILMVLGQIISLFGNQILRFALPLYLYNVTKSATLLGIVTAISFIPMIILGPIGGIVADRVNKRNVMVVLDFITAGLILIFTVLLGYVGTVPLIAITMMILYGIQGAYQPSVQASLPALLDEGQLVGGNAVINGVNSLASLIGPVAGGMLYVFYGLYPILIVSILCFFFSAVMEIFIRIPFVKRKEEKNVMAIVKGDIIDSVQFIKSERPIIAKAMIAVAGFNLLMSAMLMVGSLVIITNLLGFDEAVGNQLYGYTQGALAAGGLFGGIMSGVLAKKINIGKGHIILLGCVLGILPMGFVLQLGFSPMVCYVVITVCCFVIMAFSAMFSILALAFVQQTTPETMIGKVISLIMAISMCSLPLGQFMYGILFDVFAGAPYIPIFISAVGCLGVAAFSKKTFSNMYSAVYTAS